MVGTGAGRTHHADRLGFELDGTLVARAEQERVFINSEQATRLQAQQGIRLGDHGRVGHRAAQRDGIPRHHGQAVPGGLGTQCHVAGFDVVTGGDQHAAHNAQRTMQQHVLGGVDGQLVVVADRTGLGVAHHTGHVHIFTAEYDVAARLQPTRGLGNRDRTRGRTYLQQAEAGVALAHAAVNQHIVQTGDHDAPTRIQRGEVAGAIGVNAQLASRLGGTGADQNVTLRRQVALEVERARAFDDDAGIGTARNKVTFQRGGTRRVHHHAAVQGFKQTGGGKCDRLRAQRVGASVHIDGAVAANGTRNGDGTGGRTRTTQVNHRATAAGVNRVTALRNGTARGGCGLFDLGEAQALGTAAGHCRNAHLEIAGQHQAAVVQTHGDLAVFNAREAKRGVNGGLQVHHHFAQATQANAAACGAQGDVFRHIHCPLLQGQINGRCGAQVAVGKLDKTIGHDFLRPGGCQHRHVATG